MPVMIIVVFPAKACHNPSLAQAGNRPATLLTKPLPSGEGADKAEGNEPRNRQPRGSNREPQPSKTPWNFRNPFRIASTLMGKLLGIRVHSCFSSSKTVRVYNRFVVLYFPYSFATALQFNPRYQAASSWSSSPPLPREHRRNNTPRREKLLARFSATKARG